METNKKIVLGILISIILSFVIYICYEHFSWVKSVKDKEFRGTIIQLSSEMSHGKYPRTHEYAMILWENGETSYFEMAPVHNYSVGDTWVTRVDQGYLDISRYQHGTIPQSKEEKNWIVLFWMLIACVSMVVFIVGFCAAIIEVFIWCFSKKEEK